MVLEEFEIGVANLGSKANRAQETPRISKARSKSNQSNPPTHTHTYMHTKSHQVEEKKPERRGRKYPWKGREMGWRRTETNLSRARAVDGDGWRRGEARRGGERRRGRGSREGGEAGALADGERRGCVVWGRGLGPIRSAPHRTRTRAPLSGWGRDFGSGRGRSFPPLEASTRSIYIDTEENQPGRFLSTRITSRV